MRTGQVPLLGFSSSPSSGTSCGNRSAAGDIPFFHGGCSVSSFGSPCNLPLPGSDDLLAVGGPRAAAIAGAGSPEMFPDLGGAAWRLGGDGCARGGSSPPTGAPNRFDLEPSPASCAQDGGSQLLEWPIADIRKELARMSASVAELHVAAKDVAAEQHRSEQRISVLEERCGQTAASPEAEWQSTRARLLQIRCALEEYQPMEPSGASSTACSTCPSPASRPPHLLDPDGIRELAREESARAVEEAREVFSDLGAEMFEEIFAELSARAKALREELRVDLRAEVDRGRECIHKGVESACAQLKDDEKIVASDLRSLATALRDEYSAEFQASVRACREQWQQTSPTKDSLAGRECGTSPMSSQSQRRATFADESSPPVLPAFLREDREEKQPTSPSSATSSPSRRKESRQHVKAPGLEQEKRKDKVEAEVESLRQELDTVHELFSWLKDAQDKQKAALVQQGVSLKKHNETLAQFQARLVPGPPDSSHPLASNAYDPLMTGERSDARSSSRCRERTSSRMRSFLCMRAVPAVAD